jgi:hypothetical protein
LLATPRLAVFAFCADTCPCTFLISCYTKASRFTSFGAWWRATNERLRHISLLSYPFCFVFSASRGRQLTRFKVALLLVRLDHIASFIVNANHGMTSGKMQRGF